MEEEEEDSFSEEFKQERREGIEKAQSILSDQFADSRRWLEWLVGCTFHIEVVPIKTTYEVLALIDLLETEIAEQRALGVSEPLGFWNNRALIWDSFKEDLLFVLQMEPDGVAWKDKPFWDDLQERGGLFLNFSKRVLPCFCTIDSFDNPRIDMIWTWRPLRCLGLARRFVEHFKINEVNHALHSSKPFWNACAVKINSYA